MTTFTIRPGQPVSYAPYEAERWDAWESTLIQHANGMSREDTKAYLPSPAEVDERAALIRRLRVLPLPELYRFAMFVHDDPPPEEFVQVVDREGVRAAIERYRDRMTAYRDVAPQSILSYRSRFLAD